MVIKNKYLNYLVLLYATLVPLGHALQNAGIVLLFLYWVLSIIKYKTLNKKVITLVLLFSGYVLINGISLLYTDNFSRGFSHFLRQLPLLIIPFLLFTSKHKLTKKTIYNCILLISFSLSFVIVSNFINLLFTNDFNFSKIMALPGKDFALGLINYHYLYLSYYILSCMVFLLYYLLINKSVKISKFQKIYIIITSYISLAYLVFIGSRISLVIAAFFVLYIIVILLKRKTSLLTKSIICSTIIIIGVLTSMSNLQIVTKAKELVNYNNEYSGLKTKWGGRFMRQEIWTCSGNLIENKPLLGYGLGSVQNKLNICLATTTKNPRLYTGRYKFNAHNQFLQFWLNSGIFSLIWFIGFITISSYKSLKQKKYLFIIFIILSSISFTTESMLERNHGIIFFAFISSILYSTNLNKSSKKIFKNRKRTFRL